MITLWLFNIAMDGKLPIYSWFTYLKLPIICGDFLWLC